MLVLIGFAFLAGFVTILSPCILPLLPIILSNSVEQGKLRPYGVVLGFILSFTFFTLALTAIVQLLGVPSDLLRNIAIVILLLFGVSLLFPKTSVWLEQLFSKLSSGKKSSNEPKTGFGGGIVVGISLGLVWAPCVGPILASVIALAATSSITTQAIFITLAYSVGTAIPMLVIILSGRAIFQKIPTLYDKLSAIQKVFGVIMILTAVALFYGYDQKFQRYILEKFPSYGAGLTQFEDNEKVFDLLDDMGMDEKVDYIGEGDQCEVAPGFEEGGEWFNSEALNIEELKGKVVLVDFWTYSCINCIRTLPFINDWQAKYADDGLVIVGVHTPEFEFEKVSSNVQDAMANFDIEYPVVLDNDYKIWRAYENRYWPAKYFVNKDGCIVDSHFGEGEYAESEMLIQELLAEAGSEVDEELSNFEEYQSGVKTPELYLGYDRIENLASPEDVVEDEVATYSFPEELGLDHFAYEGEWMIGEERAMPKIGAKLRLNFTAMDVYMVMRTEGNEEISVKIYLDGEEQEEIEVNEDRLYDILRLNERGEHILELEFLDDGVEIYTFTFG